MSWLHAHLLGLGLGLLGIGGTAAALYFIGPVACLAILRSIGKEVGSALSKLNAQGWIGLLAVTILSISTAHFALSANRWKAQEAKDAHNVQVEKAAAAQIASQAVDLKQRTDALTSSLTQAIKERTDAENSHLVATTDALRLSGPGKAVCASHPVIAAAPVQRGAPAGADSGPSVPSDNRAAVPWSWLVTVIREHDQMRNDLQAVEDQHTQLEQAWPQTQGAKK